MNNFLPYMSEGSLRDIISTGFHNGLTEDLIVIVLKKAIMALNDIHKSSQVHKCFTAGNIFVNFESGPVSNVQIKLASNVVDRGSDPGEHSVLPLNKLQEWAAAPEVFRKKYYNYDSGDKSYYTDKSDIWLVGIAALELAYGNIRVRNRKELDSLIAKMKKSNRLPNKMEDLLDEITAEKNGGKMKKVIRYFKDKLKFFKERDDRMFSYDFEDFVFDCLSRKASKRPTVEKLLQRPLFFNARTLEWFQVCVLQAKKPVPSGDDE